MVKALCFFSLILLEAFKESHKICDNLSHEENKRTREEPTIKIKINHLDIHLSQAVRKLPRRDLLRTYFLTSEPAKYLIIHN